MHLRVFRNVFIFCGSVGAAFVVACSSNSGPGFSPGSTEYTPPSGGTMALESPGACTGPVGGSVVGPPDDHCDEPDGGRIAQVTTAEGCTAGADAAPAGGDDGGGSGDPCAGDMNAYGAVMYDNWGSDDDCKYDVSWQSTPICENQPVYFTVIATKRVDGTPVTGVEVNGEFVAANPRPDVVLSCDHPIPNVPAPRNPSPEVGPGTFVVGPIAFDKPGRWVFRLHFNEECQDYSPESPHGHAAFYIDVP